ncbi:MAG: thiamine phosphate synthase [Deltaproteobacteria bacterium]|nr:thiamine phosphate synthase [Deltaproteobacteria bacterium]
MTQGLYAICDISFSSHKSQHELAQQLLAGGAKILQLRMKNAKDLNRVREQAQKILEEKKNYNFCFVLNDYVELALELGVDGIHVGENDLPVSEVRKIVGPQMLIGYSSHSIEEAKQAEAEGADYVALGAIFPTATKGPGRPVQGLEKLKEFVAQISIPKVAIGGITWDNLEGVLNTGVDAIAMITALSKAEDVSKATELYIKKIATLSARYR